MTQVKRDKGPEHFAVDAPLRKGEEMGWFEHGSTILAFAPAGVALCDTLHSGAVIKAGEPLMRLPGPSRRNPIRLIPRANRSTG